jgi:hypothetical protein
VIREAYGSFSGTNADRLSQSAVSFGSVASPVAASAPPRGLDLGDVDLLHLKKWGQ